MEKLINNISDFLQQELELTEERKEIAAYGLYVMISTVVGIFSIILVAWLLGVLKLALISVVTASGLRVLSGGAHSANLRNCTLLGVIVAPAIGWISVYFQERISSSILCALVLTVAFLGILSIIKYAPADNPNKPIISSGYRHQLKRLSLAYVSIWLVAVLVSLGLPGLKISFDIYLASTLGIVWQAFSITPVGYRLVAAIDDLLP